MKTRGQQSNKSALVSTLVGAVWIYAVYLATVREVHGAQNLVTFFAWALGALCFLILCAKEVHHSRKRPAWRSWAASAEDLSAICLFSVAGWYWCATAQLIGMLADSIIYSDPAAEDSTK